MRTLGRFTLLQRTEVGGQTETWFALGPDGPVRVSRILPTLREAPWIDSHLKRVQAAAHLSAPWVKTHFAGLEAGEPIHVRALKQGVRIGELVREGAVTLPTAARCALTICDALAQAKGLEGVEQGVGEHAVSVGWDGALQLAGPDLDFVPPPMPVPNDAVFRVVSLLSLLIRGAEERMTRMARPMAARALPIVDGPLKGLFERYRGGKPHASAAELRDALIVHAAPEAEARRDLSDRVRGPAFVVERSIELARLNLDPAAKLEPLPDDHVAKVNAGQDSEGDWLVLGDWLQGKGHPRGKLIALQLEGLAEEAESLIAVTPELRVPVGSMDATLTWRWGYVDSVRLMSVDGTEQVRLMLAHPSMRFLQELDVFAGDAATLVRTVQQVRPPPTLKTLRGPKLREQDIAALRKAWPQLQRVT